MSTRLNIPQERELHRLLEHERATCSMNGETVYRCAFPLRDGDTLQRELIERGMLSVKQDARRGSIVVISTDGYSYFAELQREETEKQRAAQRETRLVTFSVMLGAICAIVGFILGHIFA